MNVNGLMGFSIDDARYHQLIALLRGERAPRDCDWDALVTLAIKERVAPILYDTLKRNSTALSDSARQRLARAYHHTLASNLRKFQVVQNVLARFNVAGISSITLKGIALAELVYAKIGVRPMADIDLLVKIADAERAVALLRDAGFREGGKPELRPGFDREFRVEKELLSPQPASQMVEVHWRLTAPLFASRWVNYDQVWARATPVEIEQQPTFVLSAEDWLLHQAAHAIYKHRHIGVLDLLDAHQLVVHFGARLNWDAVLHIGAQFRWLPALAIVLERAATILGTPVPMRVIERARAFRLTGLDRKLMGWWLTPGRAERHHIFPDWIVAPSIAARARFIAAYIFPSRAYIRASSKSNAPTGWLYLARLWREAGL